MTKTKAKYTGEMDPEFKTGEVYETYEVKENFGGKMIAAENRYGEAYLMPRELFKPIDD